MNNRRRLPFLSAALAAGLLSAGATGLRAQTATPPHPPILPLTPAELLPLLPTAPPGWELKQSRARNTFTDWLFADAQREFSHPPPPPKPGAAPAPATPGVEPTPAPPWITRVKIFDFGYDPAGTADFANFKPGKAEGGESLMLDGLPANLLTLEPGSERLRICVRRRFVVQVETLNQPANSAVAWAKAVDFKRLAQVPDSGATKLPRPIPMVTVDELDPKKSKVSSLSWMSDEEMQAAARQPAAR